MALIVLMLSFIISKPEKDSLYGGFDEGWYQEYGNYVCKSLYMSALISNIIDLIVFMFYYCKRLINRRFKSQLKKDIDDDWNDEVNTTYKYHS